MGVTAQGVVFTGPGEVEIESFQVKDPGPQQVLVRQTRTLVSAGATTLRETGVLAPSVAVQG